MVWHSRSELEEEGPPTRKELFWAIAVTPLLLFQIVGWSVRIGRGLTGETLTISRVFEIYALRSDSSWLFAAGVVMYVIFIAFALLLLWACSLQFQRWYHWKYRR
jgi:hypothetical protein